MLDIDLLGPLAGEGGDESEFITKNLLVVLLKIPVSLSPLLPARPSCDGKNLEMCAYFPLFLI